MHSLPFSLSPADDRNGRVPNVADSQPGGLSTEPQCCEQRDARCKMRSPFCNEKEEREKKRKEKTTQQQSRKENQRQFWGDRPRSINDRDSRPSDAALSFFFFARSEKGAEQDNKE